MSNQTTIKGDVSFNQSNNVTAIVKLWEANNKDAIGEHIISPEAKGKFTIKATPKTNDTVLYITAELHDSKVVLLSVLSPNFKEKITKNGIVINELTTVASAFTCAQFFNGLLLTGNLHGIRIAAKNTPNLINPLTGTYGEYLYIAGMS